jgi:hypothetical protein
LLVELLAFGKRRHLAARCGKSSRDCRYQVRAPPTRHGGQAKGRNTAFLRQRQR